MAVTTQMRTDVAELYVALFGRAPDADGLGYWVNQIDTGVLTLNGAALAMYNTDPARAYYPLFLTNNEFVTSVYTNVLGRTPDADGLAYWSGRIASVGKAGVVLEMIDAVNSYAGTDPVGVAAKALFQNKVVVGEYYAEHTTDGVTNATAAISAVTATSDVSTPAAIQALISAGGGAAGQTFVLTTGVDNIVGTSGNDTINGQYAPATNGGNTLSGLDTIDGGAGNDTLNINDVTGGSAALAGITVKNVETINLNSTGAANIDISTNGNVTGATALNVIGGTTATVTAGATTAVKVSGITSTATVTGGSTQDVTSKNGMTLSGAKGAVTAVDAAQVNGAISINDGTDIKLTTTTTGTGTVDIGAANHLPTGNVNVVQNLNGTGALTGGAITVNGGVVDTVTVNATQATANTTTTIGSVNVNGGASTTTVTVNQTAVVAPVAAVTAVAGVHLADNLTFSSMTVGQTVTVDGLTFTAGGTLTAAQAAAAFANLSAGATHGASTLGTYSGALSANFTSGAVSTATVAFTAVAASAASVDVTVVAVGATAPVVAQTAAGVTAVAAVAAVGGIAQGTVSIWDINGGDATKAGVITTATVNGYAAGYNYIDSNALTTVSLANSSVDSEMWLGVKKAAPGAATTLNLTVNNLATGSLVDLEDYDATAYTTLNLTTAGKDSIAAIVGSGVQTLSINGTNSIDLTVTGNTGGANLATSFSALKTVTISGAAGVKAGTAFTGASVTDVNASATSGNVTATIVGTQTTYEGGSGVDKITLTGGATKAVSLGAGNDSLTLAAGTTAPTAALDGGAGTDTLVMNAADAVTASLTSAFATKVTGFEVLSLNTAGAGAQAIDLAMLGNYASVTDIGTAGTLTLNNFANNGTLTITAASAGTHVLSNSAFTAGTADNVNLVVSAAGGINAGTVTADKVESFAITSTDTTASVVAGTNTNTVTLGADSTLKTITVTGNANLNLTSANTTVTSVDASGMTGGLIYTTAGTTAETVKGGAAANQLTAAAGSTADTLIGGAGNDKITSNSGLDTLTGNGGNDVFVISTPTNLNSYATVTDANAGDRIAFANKGTETFAAAKLALASTAVFQDYVNAAVNAGGDASTNGYIAWFQYGTDTYVVESRHNASTTHDFQNGADVIVKLTGLADLSTATLNAGDGTYGATISLH